MGLEGVELVLEVEDVFGIDITDEEVGHLRTVGDLHQCILANLKSSNPRKRGGRCTVCRYPKKGLTKNNCPECGSPLVPPDDIDAEEIWDELVLIISIQLALKPEYIHPSSRFNEDLNIG